MQIALASITIISALLFLYPYVIYPMVVRMMPRVPVQFSEADIRFSLLFCAYNEHANIKEKIANLEALKQLYPSLEILAYDDDSSDDTGAVLESRSDILTVIRGKGRNGKAHGMKLLAARAKGDVLVFTDANVILQTDALESLRKYYGDPAVGGVLGSLRYTGEGESATAAVGSLYWRLEERLKDLESRCGNVMGADGSIFSVRRTLYPEFPDTVLDDMAVSMAVVFAGKRLIKARDVIAYEHLVSARADEFRRKTRIAARAWHTHSYLRTQLRSMSALDRFKYVSRKYLRWFGGLFLVIGVVGAGLFICTLSIWMLGGYVFTLIILGMVGLLVRTGPFAAITDALLAYVATLIGLFRAMGGRTMSTWNPAQSR
ncbi:glycosyltransferase [Rhizorhapis sp. SPR117]|uniref:glycosyltransferase n=1 Tax=Rhizorhapis sp. SPR117 TaxID=2912611 RepID=UPI001F357807|nr:glycosyltransferase [Rhizorhapis sp. SPR117]